MPLVLPAPGATVLVGCPWNAAGPTSSWWPCELPEGRVGRRLNAELAQRPEEGNIVRFPWASIMYRVFASIIALILGGRGQCCLRFDRERQEAFHDGRFAWVHRARMCWACTWTQGFLTLDSRTNQGGGKMSPCSKNWDTLDKARVPSDRGYDSFLLNAFLRVLSPFSQPPQGVTPRSPTSLFHPCHTVQWFRC